MPADVDTFHMLRPNAIEALDLDGLIWEIQRAIVMSNAVDAYVAQIAAAAKKFGEPLQ